MKMKLGLATHLTALATVRAGAPPPRLGPRPPVHVHARVATLAQRRVHLVAQSLLVQEFLDLCLLEMFRKFVSLSSGAT